MSTPEERLIALLIAWTLTISATVASCGIAGLTADRANAETARTSEIHQSVPEALPHRSE